MYTSLFHFIQFFCRKHLAPLTGLLIVGLLWAVHFCLSPTLVKSIIDGAVAASKDNLLPLLAPFFCYVGLTLLLLGISTWYDALVMKMFPAMRAEIIEELHHRLLSNAYRFFQRHLAGSIANKVSDLSKGIVTIVTSFIDDFFSRSILFLFGTFTLYMVHPLFAAVLFGWVVVFFGLSLLFLKGSFLKTALFSEARSTVMGKMVDGLTNIFNIKIFSAAKYERWYLHSHILSMKTEEKQLHAYLLRLKLVQGISITFLMTGMILLLFYTYGQGWTTIGDFALVLSLTTGIVDETFFLALQLVQWTEEIGVAKQAFALFVEPVAEENPNLPKLHVSQGEIVLDHISFFYTPHRPIFENLSLRIHPGAKIGIVGLSGSGKSTLAHLILRLYEVTSGKIFIDGQDIALTSKESVARHVGMVPQEPALFNRSVYENILYGRLEATEEEVIAAAKKGNCHDMIMGLSHGYHTSVGERGTKLSGGQRQLVALARLFLKNPPILILDEPTSALDFINERKMQESLAALMQGRTVLMIAHRLATLAPMDTIVVMERGRLVEQGSHSELLQAGGRYAQLWGSSNPIPLRTT